MYVVTSWFRYAEEVDNQFFATKEEAQEFMKQGYEFLLKLTKHPADLDNKFTDTYAKFVHYGDRIFYWQITEVKGE